MLRFAPNDVEAAILYSGPCPDIAFAEILDHLNATFRGAAEPFRYSAFVTEASTMFVGSGLFILITKSPRPLARQSFAASLESPYTRMTFEAADAAVAGHRSNMFITVSSDSLMGDAARDMKAGLRLDSLEQRPEVFETKLAICKTLTQFICGRSEPSAVHWRQSSQLLRPGHFMALADLARLPTPLLVHPSYFSSNRVVAGRRLIGARGGFSEHLINRSVIFNETPASFRWIYERICGFVEMVRARGGELIADGETFGAHTNEVIRVAHEGPSEKDPAGIVYLTLESSDEIILPPPPPPPKPREAGAFGRRQFRFYQ